jgi:hypothetical protein
VKLIDTQEETDATRALSAHLGALLIAVGTRQEEADVSARWAHDDPSLRPAIIGQRRHVLDELEVQDVDEKGESGIVLIYEQRDEVDVTHFG